VSDLSDAAGARTLSDMSDATNPFEIGDQVELPNEHHDYVIMDMRPGEVKVRSLRRNGTSKWVADTWPILFLVAQARGAAK
jgi:hypothetical protein